MARLSVDTQSSQCVTAIDVSTQPQYLRALRERAPGRALSVQKKAGVDRSTPELAH